MSPLAAFLVGSYFESLSRIDGSAGYHLQCRQAGHKKVVAAPQFDEVGQPRAEEGRVGCSGVTLDAEEAVLEVRAKSLQTELIAKQAEKALLMRTTESRKRELSVGRTRMRELRGADAAKSGSR